MELQVNIVLIVTALISFIQLARFMHMCHVRILLNQIITIAETL